MQRYPITLWLQTGCAGELGSLEAKVIVLEPALYIAAHGTLKWYPLSIDQFDMIF